MNKEKKKNTQIHLQQKSHLKEDKKKKRNGNKIVIISIILLLIIGSVVPFIASFY